MTITEEQFTAFVDDLIECVVAFEGIQERHRQFLIGYIGERASHIVGKGPSTEQKALVSALKRAQRTAMARNVTETERRLLIRDLLAPYLKSTTNVGVSTTGAKTVVNGTASPPRRTGVSSG